MIYVYRLYSGRSREEKTCMYDDMQDDIIYRLTYDVSHIGLVIITGTSYRCRSTDDNQDGIETNDMLIYLSLLYLHLNDVKIWVDMGCIGMGRYKSFTSGFIVDAACFIFYYIILYNFIYMLQYFPYTL